MATPGALASFDLDAAVLEVANGAIPTQMAAGLNVHRSSLLRRLHEHPDYRTARELGMEARLDNAEAAVMSADECNIRVRDVQFRTVAWRAEREHPARWGAKQQIDVRAVQVQLVQFSDLQQVAAQQGVLSTVASAQIENNTVDK